MFNKNESRLVNKRHKSYKKGHSLRRKPIATITESIRLSIAIPRLCESLKIELKIQDKGQPERTDTMDNMMLLLLVLPLGAFSYRYDYMGPPFVDINCTTDHEAQTHTINIFWKVDPPANLNLTPAQISYRLADARADIDCDSTNRTVANDYSRTSDDISDKHQLSYEISTHYQYYESCEVLVFYDDFDDPSQNFSITTTVKECQLEVPSKVLSTPSNMSDIKEGSTFNISFEYYAVPPPTITCYINDEFYEIVDNTTSHGTQTTVFTDASQRVWYQCVVENEFGSDNYTSFVEIVVPSIVLSTSSNMIIKNGSTFSISFEYSAVPPPTFTWYINDELYETVNNTTSHGTHTMVFTNASQGGWYQCVVENEFGIDNYTSFVEIVVPSKVLSTPSNRSIQEGSTFNISFEYYAVPSPNFTWYINDDIYETVNGTANNGTHTMTFTNASQGWYRCVLENSFGTDEYSAFISIKGTPIPSATSGPSAAIIISIVVALILFVFIVVCLGVATFKWRRTIFSTTVTWDREKEANYMMPPVDSDYHSECGRDAPSTVESLGYNNDKVHEWMKGVHMPTIDEDGDSIISENLSTEEMLNRVCGNQPNKLTNSTDPLPDSGISTVNSGDSSIMQKGSTYITETKVVELLHGTSYKGKVLAETPSSDQVDSKTNSKHFGISYDDDSLADHNIALQGQYIHYNSATDPNTAADNSNHNRSLPQLDTRLPSASDSVMSNTISEGTYIGHSIASGNDGACHDQKASTSASVGSDWSELVHSTAPLDDNAPHDNHCSTPTTGVYQSYMDNTNSFQTVPVDTEVTQSVVPPSTATNAFNSVEEGDYVGYDIASSDVNTNQSPATNGCNADFLTSHTTTSNVGEYVSYNAAVVDVHNRNGFLPHSQDSPSSQGIIQPVSNLPDIKANSVSSSISSLPYVSLNEGSDTIPPPQNTQTTVAGEYVPYSTARSHDKTVTDSIQTANYLPYHEKDHLPSDEIAKENNLQFLSNSYVTTSV
ncbi:uncharacterized protein [Dysidea avara]|uniref:uncharacterized protein isoform X3 n=1 Tax=Dysidea avara TaxID=196820 RepID=UPI00332DD5DA